MVQTIVAMAHGLGLRVVAEGVETVEQLEHLRGLGCEYAQGFYFAKPPRGECRRGVLDALVQNEAG